MCKVTCVSISSDLVGGTCQFLYVYNVGWCSPLWMYRWQLPVERWNHQDKSKTIKQDLIYDKTHLNRNHLHTTNFLHDYIDWMTIKSCCWYFLFETWSLQEQWPSALDWGRRNNSRIRTICCIISKIERHDYIKRVFGPQSRSTIRIPVWLRNSTRTMRPMPAKAFYWYINCK